MLERLLNILLPSGGYVLQMVEAYFDESGTHDGSPVMCVAGYVIEKDSCIRMNDEWTTVLNTFNLPYFRMSLCAHGVKPFDKLTKDQRIEVVKAMIGIIKERTSYGIAVTVEPKMYDAIIPKSTEVELDSNYSFCAWKCLTAVSSWADEKKYLGKIAYFFEAGHKSASQANKLMSRIFNIPHLRKSFRYSSHTFADKEEIKPLQAGDLLAWQWFTDCKHRMNGQPRRLDCSALVEDGKPPHDAFHMEEWQLRGLSNLVLQTNYPQTYPWR